MTSLTPEEHAEELRKRYQEKTRPEYGPEFKERIISSTWLYARADKRPCRNCDNELHYGGRCSLPWNGPYFLDMEDSDLKDRLAIDWLERYG